MINASREFKEKLKSGANIVNYADATLADGTVLHLEPKDFMIGGCSIEDKTTDGKFGVGFCIGKTLAIKLSNHDERFSQHDFYGATIHLYVATLLDDSTIERLRKGIYYAMVPSTPGDIIQISAMDGMYRLDRDYSASSTVYPATLQTILTEACLDCGIPIGFRQFDNMDFIVRERPEKATYRQVVSWAAQIAGYNARIDNAGYMQLIWYNTNMLDMYNYNGGDFKVYPHDTVIDGGNFTDYSFGTVLSGGDFTDDVPEHIFRVRSLDVHTDDVQITGVRIVTGNDVSELYGEEGYVIEVKDNPFSAGKEREVADYLGGRMTGMLFRPFSAQLPGNPLYEPFDIVRVSDKKGNTYNSLINSVSYTVGSYTQIACEAEDPLRNGSTYFSEAAAAVAESRKKSEKQLTEYDKAVQNMNQLAGNALGYHTTYETQPDGSRITYLHDKPNLADSKTIYKQTIDGFFISTDGGTTYTAGFDSQGNVVVNILYAIGIVADWIRTGRFQVRKGDRITFLADADTGEVQIVADSFSLSSGDTIDSIAQDKADSALDNAKKYADKSSQDAVEAQTQLSIFNKLTNNGQTQGIYLKDRKVYINGTYIQTGTISVKKGDKTTFLANTDTGEVRIVADSFSLSSGQTIDSIAQGKVDNFVTAVYDPKIASLQSQIDGQIETWYQTSDPSTAWTTADQKNEHKGDMWFNSTSTVQKTYRWTGTKWEEMKTTPPPAVFDQIDGKAQVFVSTPKPPYDIGDLWFNSSTSDIMTCVTKRSSGNYVASDWQKRNKYIDQTAADTAANNAVNAQTQADIFNRLTNNGELQGIYMQNGKLYINATYMVTGKISSKDGRVYFDLDKSELRCDRLVSKSSNSTNANIIGYIGRTVLGNRFVDGFTICNTTYEQGLIAFTPGDSNSKPSINVNEEGLSIYSRVSHLQMKDSGVAGISTSANGYVLLYGGRKASNPPTDSEIENAANNIRGAYIMITPEAYASGTAIYTLSKIYVRGDTHFANVVTMAGLEVTGPKSRIANTKNYGIRSLYCYEMPSPMFGDIGEAMTDENGKCYVYLDDIFAETVTVEIEYQVFLQKEGPGDIWIEEKTPVYFLVRGTENLKFAWEIKARQTGFEFERLENKNTKEAEPINLESVESNYAEEINQIIKMQEDMLYETT